MMIVSNYSDGNVEQIVDILGEPSKKDRTSAYWNFSNEKSCDKALSDLSDWENKNKKDLEYHMENVMRKSNEFEIKEDVRIPGTNVVLEAGDKIRLVNEKYNEKDYQILVKAITEKIYFYKMHKNYNDNDLYELVTSAAEAAVNYIDRDY